MAACELTGGACHLHCLAAGSASPRRVACGVEEKTGGGFCCGVILKSGVGSLRKTLGWYVRRPALLLPVGKIDACGVRKPGSSTAVGDRDLRG
ncbi:MAG: hypothetical protein JWL97_4077 [Gemmatimonadales bacterium]|nr:hypothetical protein [Gemmatimonadales bacterium]